MADFVAVLRKTIDGLADNTPALREKVYDKARSTVAAKLAAINPPPPAAVADRQKQVLENAIREVEASYSGAIDDPFAELENVFAAPVKKEPQPAAKVLPAAETRAPSFQPKAPAPVQSRTQAPLPPLPGNQVGQKPWPGDERDAEPVTDVAAVDGSATPYEADEQEEEETVLFEERPERRRRSYMPLIAAVVVLGLILGGGYAVWLNKDDFLAMLGMDGAQTVTAVPSASETAPVAPPPATAVKPSGNDGAAEAAQKYTQRLNADGSEIDPGPAGGIASIGEGTSVAEATQPSQPPVATDATPAPPPADAMPAAPAVTDSTPATDPAVRCDA